LAGPDLVVRLGIGDASGHRDRLNASLDRDFGVGNEVDQPGLVGAPPLEAKTAKLPSIA
jgi:hypothetical protein